MWNSIRSSSAPLPALVGVREADVRYPEENLSSHQGGQQIPSLAVDLLEAGTSVEAVVRELKIYGNHCGPLHGSATVPATDHVDQACLDHDRDYGKNGYFDLESDLRLIGRLIEEQFSEDLSARERAASLVVALAFITIMPVSIMVTLARETLAFYGGVGRAIADGAEKVWNKLTSWF
jgi:hypothetical protein